MYIQFIYQKEPYVRHWKAKIDLEVLWLEIHAWYRVHKESRFYGSPFGQVVASMY